MTNSLTFDLAETRAILIGCSQYPKDSHNLPALPSILNNISTLKEILTDSNIVGLPAANVTVLEDRDSFEAIQLSIAEIAGATKDTLVVYYAGHGLVGPDSRSLYLATSGTTLNLVDVTALPFNNLRRLLYSSPAKRKILILDCCFSGLALEVMGTSENLLQSSIGIQGTYAMASAPANEFAIAPLGSKYTVFTGELIGALENGIDSESDVISLGELFDHVRRKIRFNPNMPEPKQSSIYDGDRILIAHNVKKTAANLSKRMAAVESALAAVPRISQAIDALKDQMASIEKKLADPPTAIKPADVRLADPLTTVNAGGWGDSETSVLERAVRIAGENIPSQIFESLTHEVQFLLRRYGREVRIGIAAIFVSIALAVINLPVLFGALNNRALAPTPRNIVLDSFLFVSPPLLLVLVGIFVVSLFRQPLPILRLGNTALRNTRIAAMLEGRSAVVIAGDLTIPRSSLLISMAILAASIALGWVGIAIRS